MWYLLPLLFLTTHMQGQENRYSISGKVTGPALQELTTPGFVEIFKSQDSTLVTFQNTGDNGAYKLQGLLEGTYFMRISHPDFAVYLEPAFLLDSTISNKDFTLNPSSFELDEVVLTEQLPIASLEGDQLNVFVERIPGIEGDNSFELLSKLPGVWIEGDNSLKVNGSNEVTILINGRRQGFRNTQDINLLKTISANNIKKVEIISGGSAKYDATGGSIINVITKSKSFDGLNLNLTNSVLVNREVSNSHNLYVNVTSGKFSASASVGYGITNNYFEEFGMSVYNMDSANQTAQDYQIDYESGVEAISAYTNFNYDIDPRNSINLNLTNYRNSNAIDVNQISSYEGAENFNLGFTNHRNVKDNLTSVNLNYEHKMDTIGTKFIANVGYLDGFIKENQNFRNEYFFDETLSDSLALGNASIPLEGNQFISGLDIEIPWDDLNLELGTKYTDGMIENFVTYNTITENGSELDVLRSDSLVYEERVFAAYVMAGYTWSKFSLKAGARLEYTENNSSFISTGTIASNSYTNILPNVALSYSTKGISTSLKFTSGITRPDYVYLNPYQYYINDFEFREGNPNLLPLKRNTITLESAISDFLNISFGYHRYNDMIFVVGRQPGDGLQTINRPENAASLNDFFANISLYYSLLNDKFRGQLSFYGETYNYDIKEEFITDEEDLEDFTYFTVRFDNSYKLLENLSVYNRFSYRSNSTFYQIFQRERYRLDLGFTAELFEDQVKITAGVDDIFDTYNYENRNYYDGFENTYFRDLSLQRFRMSVIFNLDKGWKKATSRKGKDNSEEQSRFKN